MNNHIKVDFDKIFNKFNSNFKNYIIYERIQKRLENPLKIDVIFKIITYYTSNSNFKEVCYLHTSILYIHYTDGFYIHGSSTYYKCV
jgi:hypothetical protein